MSETISQLTDKLMSQINLYDNQFFIYGVSAGKRDQIEIFFKKKFLSKIDVDLIIWSRTFIISKKIFLSIWSLFPALTPYILHISQKVFSKFIYLCYHENYV